MKQVDKMNKTICLLFFFFFFSPKERQRRKFFKNEKKNETKEKNGLAVIILGVSLLLMNAFFLSRGKIKLLRIVASSEKCKIRGKKMEKFHYKIGEYREIKSVRHTRPDTPHFRKSKIQVLFGFGPRMGNSILSI